MFAPEWWHWVLLGFILIISELLVPAFFIIWFGLAALAVAFMLFIFPELSVAAQLLIWSAASAALVTLWFRYFKLNTVTLVGTSAANLAGEIGVLTSDIGSNSRGHVRFQKPILGSDLWECYADTELKIGDRVRVITVEGSYIKVESTK